MTVSAPERTFPQAEWPRVADEIREQIVNGQWAPGEKLPSHDELAAAYGLNATTIRKALHALQRQGLLRIAPGGAGTRVTDTAATVGL
jgi:DNA-binding GntR family transcriptional regulator